LITCAIQFGFPSRNNTGSTTVYSPIREILGITLKIISLIVISFALVGCGSGSSSPDNEPRPSSVTNQSPGGFWVGTDSDSEEVIAIISEDGLLYFLAGKFKKGSGFVNVNNGGFVNGIFLLSDEHRIIFPNEKLNPDCNLNGSVTERNFMTLDVKCRRENDQQVLTTLALNYDARYELESSLAIITGGYKYTPGMVLSIDASGIVFGQDADTGCVINGHVAVINTDFNMYDIEWSNMNCVGQVPGLNGRAFDGLVLLDNTVVPNQLIIAVSGVIEDPYVSIIRFAERL
jgi:hypothetical protein